MSIIFKTLKKLRSQSSEEEKAGRLKRGKNLYSFRRILFSPSSIFLIVIFIFLSGLAVIYGMSYLTDSMHAKRRRLLIDQHTGIKTTSVQPNVKSEHIKPENNNVPVDIPPSPDIINVQGEGSERLRLVPKPVERSVPEVPVYARYYPRKQYSLAPEKSIINNRLMSPPVEAAGLSRDRIQEGPTFKKEVEDKKGSPALIPKAEYFPRSPKPGDIPLSATGVHNNVILPPLQPQQGAHFQPRETGVLEEGTLPRRQNGQELRPAAVPASTLVSNKTYVAVQEGALETRRPKELEAGRPESGKIYPANINKSAQISRLVTMLQRSINREEDTKAKDILGRLSALKGEDNIYVMKMRAFLHIRNQDYEPAAMLLEKVLEHDSTDLEAGINMAVIEINTNRIQEAKKRLGKLREVHSDNIFIPELLKRLK